MSWWSAGIAALAGYETTGGGSGGSRSGASTPVLRNKLLSLFEVRHLSHTITEYAARLPEGDNVRSYARLLFLRNRVLYSIILVGWLVSLIICRHHRYAYTTVSVLFVTLIGYLLTKIVVEETVSIIQQFGIQIKWKYLYGREKVQFIEMERLHAVFIHEFIQGSEVRFALAFEVKNNLHAVSPSSASHNHHRSSRHAQSTTSPASSTSLLLSFHEVYPGYDALRKVYRACEIESTRSGSSKSTTPSLALPS